MLLAAGDIKLYRTNWRAAWRFHNMFGVGRTFGHSYGTVPTLGGSAEALPLPVPLPGFKNKDLSARQQEESCSDVGFTCRDEERATAVKDPLAKGVCRETCKLQRAHSRVSKDTQKPSPKPPLLLCCSPKAKDSPPGTDGES